MQPNYDPSRTRRAFYIEPKWPWTGFRCYPIPGYSFVQQYSFPGCQRFTAPELMRMCKEWGWRIREVQI